MKKIILFISLLLLVSCSNNPSSTSSSTNPLNKLFFASDLEEKDLPKPKEKISSLDEMIYALDYLAFYQIDKKVSFYIDNNYSKTFYNIYQEFSKAQEQVQIADVYPSFINYSLYVDYKVITINVVPQQIATKSNSKLEASKIYEIDYQKESSDHQIPLEKSNLKEIEVETSQQLYYVVENKYKPILKKNSIAEKIYSTAKDILNSIIDDTMNEYQKAKQIYNYICSEISYDYITSGESTYNLNENQAYFLEGFFLNQNAVCDGKSKAYSLLCNMENIDNVRVTAINDKYQGHAYNYIKIFDKWYLSCTTFGSHRMELKENEYYIVPSLNMFLTNYQTPYASNWGYDSKMHEDIKEKIESQSNFELSIIDNLNSFKEIIESYHLNSLLNIEVEFQYFKDINLFKEDIEKEYPSYEIVLLKNLPYENNYYSIIFLSNI